MHCGVTGGILSKKTAAKLLTNPDLRVIIVKVSNFTNLLTGGGCMAKNLDAIHDTVHEMARDEARHGKALKGLLDRYFG